MQKMNTICERPGPSTTGPAGHAPRRQRRCAASRGFTLTELAIVLLIVGLLVGGMLLPLSAQQDIRARAETARQLDGISEALLGFAAVNGYFPCPAVSASDGKEDRVAATGKCTGGKRRGLLPWVTLGVKGDDAWGYLFQYSVTPAYADSGSETRFTLTTARDIWIKTRDTTGAIIDLSNKNDIPVVVLSTGKNAYWGWGAGAATQNADSATANDDEDTNSATGATGETFVSRAPSAVNSDVGEFDDQLIWISPHVLFNRMIAAGLLPRS